MRAIIIVTVLLNSSLALAQSDVKSPEPAKPAISDKHRKIAEEYCRIYPNNPACIKPKEEEKK